MIHQAYKKSKIAELYLRKLGKFKSSDQARKTFESIKKPDIKLIAEILDEIHKEAKKLLRTGGKQKET